MEAFLSAFLGELVSRSINFIISKYSKPQALAMEDSLQRAMLRAQVIIDESMGRLITNQAMLQQLDMLRDAIYRGNYALDNFRYQPHNHNTEDEKNHAVISPCFKVINSAKGSYFSGRSFQILGQVREALDRLSSMIADVDALVLIMMSYPRRYRQPYSMHLLLDNCMFGRQMETEHVINFLLHTQSPYGAEELEVLPIIGPGRVGKSTLIAHACKDERVRDHFSEIVFLNDHDFTDDDLTALRQRCLLKNHNCDSSSKKDGRFLVVVEVAGDFNEDAWSRLYSASKQWVPRGSKIIITSLTDKITKVGTTRPLTLEFLPQETFWYFFKTLTFGSTDHEAHHPRLTYLAMETARKLNGSFMGAQITARVLRDNFDIRFWCKVLALLKGFIDQHDSKFGGHPFANLNQNRPALLGRMGWASSIVVRHQYQCSSQEEVTHPKVEDVMFGIVEIHRKSADVAWKSPIPPYYSYVYACEVQEIKSKAAKRKRRSVEDGVILS